MSLGKSFLPAIFARGAVALERVRTPRKPDLFWCEEAQPVNEEAWNRLMAGSSNGSTFRFRGAETERWHSALAFALSLGPSLSSHVHHFGLRGEPSTVGVDFGVALSPSSIERHIRRCLREMREEPEWPSTLYCSPAEAEAVRRVSGELDRFWTLLWTPKSYTAPKPFVVEHGSFVLFAATKTASYYRPKAIVYGHKDQQPPLALTGLAPAPTVLRGDDEP